MLQSAHPRVSARTRLATANRALSLATAAGAPPGLISVIELERAFALPGKQQPAALEEMARAALASEESRPLGLFILKGLSEQAFAQGRPQDSIRLSRLALEQADSPLREAGWLRRYFRRVIVANSPMNGPGFAASLREAEIAADACWLQKILIPQGLNKPSFPPNSMVARLSGVVGVEADLTKDQQPAAVRVVAASPALVFDNAAIGIFTTPAAGQPVHCRGAVRVVFFRGSGKPLKNK